MKRSPENNFYYNSFIWFFINIGVLLIVIGLSSAAFVIFSDLNNKWSDGTICDNCPIVDCNCSNITNITSSGWDNSYIGIVRNGNDDSIIGQVTLFYKTIGSMKFFFYRYLCNC